jgi:hypothetical protein
MSAKQRRLSFSAPLVMTLAAAPACVVTTPTTQPAQSAPAPTVDRRTDGTHEVPPTIITNPPRPQPGEPTAPPPVPPPTTSRPAPPPRYGNPGGTTVDQTSPPPTTTPAMRHWTVTVASDKSCFAAIEGGCPSGTKATCNPPPPARIACPPNMAPRSTVSIDEKAADSCMVTYPMPSCPPGVMCNPPRPQSIACPE